MLTKILLGSVLGFAVPFGAWAMNTSASGPCGCCGSECECIDCVCDAAGCACDEGGDCACDPGCGSACCSHCEQ